MKLIKALVRSFLLMRLAKHTPRLYATAARRGGEAGKRQVTANIIKPGSAASMLPAPTRGNHFLLQTVAGFVLADILPSSTTFVHDFFEAVVQFGRDSDEDEPAKPGIEGWWSSVLDQPKNVWKPLASADPGVQQAAGAAMGVVASHLLRPVVPAAVRLATTAFVAGHVNAVLCVGYGGKWYATTSNDNVDRWLLCLDRTLDRWCMCVWSAIQNPSATYFRIRHSVDSLLRRELAVPRHVANGMIGGAVVGLMVP